MDKKLAMLLCLITIIVVGSLVFVSNQTIDFPTIFWALKITVPAGIVAYIGGFLLGKTLEKSKGDTRFLNTEAQQQFIDDLMLSPEQVLNSAPFIQPKDTQEVNSKEETILPNQDSQ